MPIHSRRLGGPTTVSIAGAVVYTCPVGRTAIIKHVGAITDGGVASSVFVGIGGTALAQRVLVLRGDNSAIPDGRRQFLVVQSGESVHAASNSAVNNWIVSLHGYELVGEPV